jgi:L-ascorbate metabolism protein UlaG (beta-lactamase superfamily)
MRKHFGAKPSKKDIEKYTLSKNWNGKKFVNLIDTKMEISFLNIPGLLYKQICKKECRVPTENIPIKPLDKEEFLAPSSEAKFIWYGHAALMMRIDNKTILIDPMLGPDASPIAPFATKRFSTGALQLIDNFPTIDAVFLSHDHYDHIDYESIQKLKSKTTHFYTALGVARHLKTWGIDEQAITEFDWWDHIKLENIEITFTPSRHFTGRGISDRAKTLWGGWIFKTTKQNIYFTGDGGYGPHFEDIGKRFGPFDIGFVECGQYNELWHQIHMYPEEAVQACIDAYIQKAMPIHWGGFALSLHTWKEPIIRFSEEAFLKKIDYFSPEIGQIFNTNSHSTTWWDAIN